MILKMWTINSGRGKDGSFPNNEDKQTFLELLKQKSRNLKCVNKQCAEVCLLHIKCMFMENGVFLQLHCNKIPLKV